MPNRIIFVEPSEIRFSQDSIGKFFQDGNSVNELVSQIEQGVKSVEDVPMISVVKLKNQYYSVDNRRLYVFRVLQKRGKLKSVKVRLVFEDQLPANGGESVNVRWDLTLPHTFGASESEQITPDWYGLRHRYGVHNRPMQQSYSPLFGEVDTNITTRTNLRSNGDEEAGLVGCCCCCAMILAVLAYFLL